MSKKAEPPSTNGTVEEPTVETVAAAEGPVGHPSSPADFPFVKAALAQREAHIATLKGQAFELTYEIGELERHIATRREALEAVTHQIKRELAALGAERNLLAVIG